MINMRPKNQPSPANPARISSPPGKGKAPYHHGDLREALLSAALDLIQRYGVQGFSLKAAAQMAGVSTAAPYRHFADKEALIAALQAQGFAIFDAALAAAFHSGQTPLARIEELGVAYVLFALQHPAHFRIMFDLSGLAGSTHPSTAKHPEPSPAEPTGFSLLVRGVDELLPHASPADRHATVLACWSLVHGYAMLQMEGAFHGMGADIETQLRHTISLSIPRIASPA